MMRILPPFFAFTNVCQIFTLISLCLFIHFFLSPFLFVEYLHLWNVWLFTKIYNFNYRILHNFFSIRFDDLNTFFTIIFLQHSNSKLIQWKNLQKMNLICWKFQKHHVLRNCSRLIFLLHSQASDVLCCSLACENVPLIWVSNKRFQH